jgi:hypothetical protein
MRFASQVELHFGGYRELAWVETCLSQYGNDDLVDAAAPATYRRIRKLLDTLHGYRMDAADAVGHEFSDVTSYLEQNRPDDYYAGRETIGLIERRLNAAVALYRAAFAHAEARAEARLSVATHRNTPHDMGSPELAQRELWRARLRSLCSSPQGDHSCSD